MSSISAAVDIEKLEKNGEVDTLIGLMSEGDSSVRQSVARALGNLKEKRAGDVLAHASIHDRDADVREAAANALEKLGDPRMVDGHLNNALTRIIVIYQRSPQGFKSGGQRFALDDMFEMQLRTHGHKLHELGGLDLMKRAYVIFTNYSDWPRHIPRDLWLVWDGIGDWKAG